MRTLRSQRTLRRGVSRAVEVLEEVRRCDEETHFRGHPLFQLPTMEEKIMQVIMNRFF